MYLRVWPQTPQVALQVTVNHQLHHNQSGLTFGYDPQQTHLQNKQKQTIR